MLRAPARGRAKTMEFEAIMRCGFLAREMHGTVVRLAPPRTIDQADSDIAVTAFAQALADVAKS